MNRWTDYVYFAHDPATGAVKIGHSGNLPSRLQRLRQKMPGLELLAAVLGDRRLEDRFHMLLIEDHLGHEWFSPSARLQAVILGVQEGWFDLSALPTGINPIRRNSALRAWEERRLRGTTGWHVRAAEAASPPWQRAA